MKPGRPDFRSTTSTRLVAQCNRMYRLSRLAGVKKTAYDRRHGFATRKLVQGHDHLTIAELMGHRDGTMLAKVYAYLDRNDAHLKRALEDCAASSRNRVLFFCGEESAMRRLAMLLFAVWLPSSDMDSTSSEVARAIPGSGLRVKLAESGSTVVFHNAGPDSVFIVKSLDGSVDGMLMPNYRFTIHDPDGRPVKEKERQCGSCGPWADTRWPQDYLVEIKPGATYSEHIWLGGYFKFAREGRHTISFEYVYQPPEDHYLNPPPQAWRGTLRAPEIVVNYKKK